MCLEVAVEQIADLAQHAAEPGCSVGALQGWLLRAQHVEAQLRFGEVALGRLRRNQIMRAPMLP
jgi:hypothetical protein